jgi:uncharacterized protein YkwD
MLRRSVLAVAGFALFASILGAAWSLASAPSASALTNCDTSEAAITPAEQTMLTLINGARAAAGVAPLKLSANLSRAAAWKSADPSATGSGGVPFSHTDSLGRSPFQRAVDCGYPPGAGENIAYGSTDPQTIFALWTNSPGHLANILLAGYKVIGIGQHGIAWTTDFGYTDDSGSVAPPPPPPTATPTSGSGGSQSGGSQPPAPTPSPSPSVAKRPSGLTPRFRASVPEVTYQ